MQTKLIFFCSLLLACATPTKKEPNKDTQTTETKAPDSAPEAPDSSATNVPATPIAWPPVGYQMMTKPMGTPTKSTPGWVELPSLSKHKAMEAVAQRKPLLNGSFDDEGMFYTDGKVDGGILVKECAKETYLNITKMTSSPTLPTAAPDTILLYLCEGQNPVEGKEGLLVPK